MKSIARTCPLKAIRAALEVSQEGLARLTNVSVSTVNRCEMGQLVPWKLMDALAKRFELSLDTAQSICNGTISEPDLQQVLKSIAKTRAKSGGK